MKQTNGSSAVLVDCVIADKTMHQGEDENWDLSSSKTKLNINHYQHSLYC